jgi:hypothetical protein
MKAAHAMTLILRSSWLAPRAASALLVMTLTALMTAPSAWAVTKTYTTDADFDLGQLLNVNHTNANQLQLNQSSKPLPFVYVACSSRGTAVRIDINTGAILGEYLTAPNGMRRNPSRTTVDKYGNVWVANRDENGFSGGQNKGSIVRIGVIIGGTRCDADATPNPSGQFLKPPFTYSTVSDRDGDGLIKTSRGLGNILTWTNLINANTDGGVSTADDEAIINYTRVTGTNARTVAVDRCNDVWVGGHGDQDHEKVDGVTGLPVAGTQFNLGCGGYGGLLDGNGILWSARSLGGLLRYDTDVAAGVCIGNNCGDYGLGIDPTNGHIWHSALSTSKVFEIAPNGTCLNNYGHGWPYAQGVAVDNVGNVWVAHSIAGGSSTTVGHVRTGGTFVGNVDLPGGNGPTGVAVDGNGKIWVTNYNTSNVMRIDPNAGAVGGGGYRIGAVDLTVNLGAGAGPYNYSDMTGFVAIGATAPSGTWTVKYDGGEPSVIWDKVSWNSDYPAPDPCDATEPPPPPTVGVEVRAADAEVDLPNQAFVAVVNDGNIAGVSGRYIEIRTTLARPAMNSPSPTLFDLTVTGSTTCPPAPLSVAGTKLYSITTDGSGGFGWSWWIDIPGTGFPGASGTVPVSPAGESALAMANRFRDAIIAHPCADNRLFARTINKTPTRADLYVQVGGPNPPDLWLADVGDPRCCHPSFALGDICNISGSDMTCTEPGMHPQSHGSPRILAGALIEEIPLSGQDCNGNGQEDEVDIAFGVSADGNGDGVPDECQLPSVVRVFAIATNKYRVIMNRSVTVGTAENEGNYTLLSTLGPPTLATQVNGFTIDLTVSGTGLAGGDLEAVTVNGLTASSSGQTMTVAQQKTFHFDVLSPAQVQGPDPDALAESPCRDIGRYQTGGPTTIRGIVQAKFDNTYYLSATNSQRDGIAVYSQSQALTLGHRYVVVGTVQEFVDETQISTIVYVADEGIAANPAAVVQTIPVVIDQTCDFPSPHLGTSTHHVNGEDFEGMLVRLNSVKVGSDDLSGRDFRVTTYPTSIDSITVANLTGSAYTYTPNQNQVINVTGILHYAYGAFVICPRTNADIVVVGTLEAVDHLPAAVSFSVAPNPGMKQRLMFALPKTDRVELGVYDVLGRQVVVIAKGEFLAGKHTRQWDGLDSKGNAAKPGMYFYRLKLSSGVHTIRSVRID